MSLKDFANAKAIELGKDVIRMTSKSGSGHPSSGLAIMHSVITLMYDVMRWDPADPWHPGNDRLVLSEGHAVPAVYAVYADMGGVVGRDKASARKLTKDDLATLREASSVLDGHPNPAEGFPFFDAATGSLGQGLSVAAGLARAARLRKIDKQIYVIIGDGESREGQIWEAMDLIADDELTNVVAIFNCNGQGQADHVSKQQSAEVIAAKAAAFNFDVHIIDGHDAEAIKAAIGDPAGRNKPVAIVARTEKGWGCASLKAQSNHGKPVPADKIEAVCSELDGTLAALGTPTDVDALSPKKPIAAQPLVKKPLTPTPFAEAIKAAGMASALEKGKIATRRAYGAALLALGDADERIVALDGDVQNSTFSEFFAKKYPERFVECKIAEQNLISAAAGMAAAGFVPFASSFAKFLSRGFDQVEMAQISRANIKLVGSHAGVSLAADGPSQMSLHDIAFFRCASETDDGYGHPACVVLHPADAVAAYAFTWMMAEHEGMCFMRTHRPDVPMLYKPDTKFEIGGSNVLAEGDAITIVSAGYMLHVCKQAVEMLAADGIRCTLVDAYSFPLDAAPILAAADKTNRRILTAEDNYLGGLGDAIALAAAAKGNYIVNTMTCRKIPKSAISTDDIMAYVGLSAADVARKAKEAVS